MNAYTKHIILIITFLTVSFAVKAQSDSLTKKYPVFVDSLNVIGNTEILEGFFQKLNELKNNERQQVRILHIGDSHIQADFMTMRIRNNLQSDFGNAGRGLIFPLRLANTNEPFDYRFQSNANWKARKIKDRNMNLDKAICGFIIETDSEEYSLDFEIINRSNKDYCFRKLSIFHEKGNAYHGFHLSDTSGKILMVIDNEEENGILSVFETDSMMMHIKLKSCGNADSLKTILYGFNLETNEPGILYHSVGVNGAEFHDYYLYPKSLSQAAILSPDLIIISLGTNDSYRKTPDLEVFCEKLDSVISHVKRSFPDIPILLTTPPHSLKKRRYPNTLLPELAWIIRDYAKTKACAYWDFYNIMGTENPVNEWFKLGLMQKDKLHFSRQGYILQGELFYNALIHAYRNYTAIY